MKRQFVRISKSLPRWILSTSFNQKTRKEQRYLQVSAKITRRIWSIWKWFKMIQLIRESWNWEDWFSWWQENALHQSRIQDWCYGECGSSFIVCWNRNIYPRKFISEIEWAQHIWCTTIISVCKHLWRKEKRKATKSWMHCILVSTNGHTYFNIIVAK